MVEWLCTCNPVYSEALNASFSNARVEDSAVSSSVCLGPEDAPVWGGGAVVTPVHKARFNMEVQLAFNGVGSWKKKNVLLESTDNFCIYSQQQ